MHLTTLPVLLTLTSLVPYALATPGYPVDALRNTFQGVINSPGFKDAVGSILHIQDKTEKAALVRFFRRPNVGAAAEKFGVGKTKPKNAPCEPITCLSSPAYQTF